MTSCGVSDEVMLMLLMVRVAALVNDWARDGSDREIERVVRFAVMDVS